MAGGRTHYVRTACLLAGVTASMFALTLKPAQAANPTAQPGSIGLEATIKGNPPSRGATITVPSNGNTFNSTPITVSGLCPAGALVKIFDNGVFVGSAACIGGSYSLKIDLFNGQNDLVARVFDSLDQEGPQSNHVSVTFNDAQYSQFGTHISLSSPYAERGAPPGSLLDWPIIISGGAGPYAISVDWGDGTAEQLLSQSFAGSINISHTYKIAGIYTVIVKATDKNGEAAFLQLVGQATGAVQNNSAKKDSGTTTISKVVWWPILAMIPIICAAFWVGHRHGRTEAREDL